MTALARGCYRYFLDGREQAVTEPWDLTDTDTGLRLSGQRLLDAAPALAVEAWWKDGRWRTCHVTDTADAAQPPTAFRLRDRVLEWQTGGADPVVQQLPEACLLFPLLRAATGPLLRALLAGPRTVLVPDIRPGSGTRLQPHGTRREARLIARADGTDQLRYFGGEYGRNGSDWWLDERDLVTAYRWDAPDGRWEIRLDELWLAPEFEGLR